MDAIKEFYGHYVQCLNNRRLNELHQFVADAITYNGKPLSLASYRQMLEQDVEQIPDLYYKIKVLETGPDLIAARLHFDCTPKGIFKGIAINGKKVSFNEDVVYQLEDGKIKRISSKIDTDTIRAQVYAQI